MKHLLMDSTPEQPTSGGAVTPPPVETPTPDGAAPTLESVSAPSTEAAPSSADSDVDWTDLSSPESDDDEGAETIIDETAAEPPPSSPPKVAQPPQNAAQPTAPQVVAPQPPVQAETPVPAQPQVQQPTPVQQQIAPPVDMRALREAEMARLEQQYAMDDDTASAMIVEPQKVLPRIAADIHMKIVDSLIPTIMAQMPRVVNTISQVERVNREAEDSFYQTWPALRKPEFQQTVFQAVSAYRQLNPRAPKDEVIRAAGLQAMISLRLPLPRELLQYEEPPTPPSASPFSPANPGGGGFAPGGRAQSNNPFVNLSDEFIEEDRA